MAIIKKRGLLNRDNSGNRSIESAYIIEIDSHL